MNITRVLGIIIAVLAVWAGAATQLTVLFGQHTADIIVTVCSLTVASLGAAIGVLSNQTNQIAAVRAMPGVEKITVNDQANPTLAKLALDPTVDKVQPAPASVQKITQIAQQE